MTTSLKSRGGLIIGSYPSAPSEEGARAQFYSKVARAEDFAGAEISWSDSSSLLVRRLFPLEATFVVTLIGLTVSSTVRDSRYGLASADELGRQAAVDDVKTLFDQVRAWREDLGVNPLLALELQSAPKATGSEDALCRSLAEVGGWDWSSTAITIEHCDAATSEWTPQKGYLGLDHEIRAIKRSGVQASVTVNWGRSAIEARSATGPASHISQVRQEGLLGGLMFSGVADKRTQYGDAWADAHLPVARDPLSTSHGKFEEGSLLTSDRILEALIAADGAQIFTGCKFAAPSDASSWSDKADWVVDSASMIADLVSRQDRSGS